MALVEHKLWQQQVRVREMSFIATVISDKFGPSAAGGNAFPSELTLSSRPLPPSPKICCQKRDAEQIEVRVRIINRLWNFVGMHVIFIVYQLETDCPGITLLGSASVNCLNIESLCAKLTYKQQANIANNARRQVVDDKGNSVCVKRDW